MVNWSFLDDRQPRLFLGLWLIFCGFLRFIFVLFCLMQLGVQNERLQHQQQQLVPSKASLGRFFERGLVLVKRFLFC
jgi:hypothetical protein